MITIDLKDLMDAPECMKIWEREIKVKVVGNILKMYEDDGVGDVRLKKSLIGKKVYIYYGGEKVFELRFMSDLARQLFLCKFGVAARMAMEEVLRVAVEKIGSSNKLNFLFL